MSGTRGCCGNDGYSVHVNVHEKDHITVCGTTDLDSYYIYMEYPILFG
jgi:hypothetical protein